MAWHIQKSYQHEQMLLVLNNHHALLMSVLGSQEEKDGEPGISLFLVLNMPDLDCLISVTQDLSLLSNKIILFQLDSSV